MLRDLKIVKIGGSVLRDGKSYIHVAEEIRKFIETSNRTIIVVSAMNGVTDSLLKALNGSREALEEVIDRYIDAAAYICGRKLVERINNILTRLKAILKLVYKHDPVLIDLVLSFGEKLSKILLIEALVQEDVKAVGVDATEVIKTNNVHGNALIKYYETSIRLNNYVVPLLLEGTIPVIEGFIGSTLEGEVTTLGRGGSDYTATTIAALLGASEVYLITNVPGILSADPRYVSHARIVPEMSYREAVEASMYGCKNLHPRTFYPLMEIHKCRVHIGTWSKGTSILEVVDRNHVGPKLIAFKFKGGYAYIALIGDGVSDHRIVSQVIDLLKHNELRYEGIYMLANRPSIVLIFRKSVFAKALNILHELIVKGG